MIIGHATVTVKLIAYWYYLYTFDLLPNISQLRGPFIYEQYAWCIGQKVAMNDPIPRIPLWQHVKCMVEGAKSFTNMSTTTPYIVTDISCLFCENVIKSCSRLRMPMGKTLLWFNNEWFSGAAAFMHIGKSVSSCICQMHNCVCDIHTGC